MSNPKHFLRHAGWVGFLTLISRITGMVQTMVVAKYLGNGAAADAFFVAWRLPNMLRRFAAEGTMTAAFLPTVNEVEQQEGEAAARDLVARFLGTMGILLLGVCLIAIVAMGLISGVLVLGRLVPHGTYAEQFAALGRVLRGAQAPPPSFALTTLLSRIMFPYLWLVSLTAGLGAVLNLRDRYGLPASISTIWNVVFVGFALACFRFGPPGWRGVESASVIFAIGVILGGIAHLFALWPTFRKLGFHIHWGLSLGHAGVRRALRRMGPGLVGLGIHPINVVVSASLASQLGEGSQAVLFNSNMLGEMVLGLFAVSVATVSLPAMSRLAEAGDRDGFKGALASALRGTALLTIPGAVGMAVLALPIVTFIFQGGRFTRTDSAWTARTVAFQAVGLLFIATSRITSQALYALKDYRTPALAGVLGVVANAVLSKLLMRFLDTGGIALANGLASLVGLLFLVHHLRGRMEVPFAAVFKGWALMLLGAAVLALVAWWGLEFLDLRTYHGRLGTALRLFPLIAVSGLAYFGAVRILGLDEARTLQRKLLRR